MFYLKKKGLVFFLMFTLLAMTMFSSVTMAAGSSELKKNEATIRLVKFERSVEWEALKASYELKKDEAEATKTLLEAKKAELEASLKAELALEDQNNIQKLSLELAGVKEALAICKTEFLKIIADLKAVIKTGFAPEVLQTLAEVGASLEAADSGLTVVLVENIMAKGKHIPFDTPPVIKSGRILVPVRALSEAYGAKVLWDEATKTITIERGDVKLILTLNEDTVMVNGVEKKLDVSVQSLKGRTVVPLRFIIEQLGLSITWDSETETAQISEDTVVTVPTT